MSDAGTPQWHAEMDRLRALSFTVAPTLVGLSVEDARSRADDAGLSLRTVNDGGFVTADFEFGRITVSVRDGVIIAADAG